MTKEKKLQPVQDNGKQQGPPPQPSRRYYALEELEVGKSYYCRLAGVQMLVVEKEKNDKFEVTAKMFIQPKGTYAMVDISEQQLFLFDGQDI